MNNPIARNIPIRELLEALTDIMLKGNKYVDVLVDDDFILRLRGMKSLKESRMNKRDKSRGIGNKQIPPLPGDMDLMDLT